MNSNEDALVAMLVGTIRECRYCDQSYVPHGPNPDSPFCSMECYNEHHTYTCEACGKDFFESTPWSLELGATRHCFDCTKKGFVPQDKTRNFLPKYGDNMELDPIKSKIQEAKKPKMRTVEQYLCDQCDKVIAQPEDGFVIHGNIYVADPSCSGGLIGNNFPPYEEGEMVSIDKIKQTVMCKPCFLRAIAVTGTTNIRDAALEVGLEMRDIDDVLNECSSGPITDNLDVNGTRRQRRQRVSRR